jgi:hypothetical protein
MAITVPQAPNNNASSATAVTVNITTTAGSLIVIWTREAANTTSTVAITDSAGQSGWLQAGGYVTPAGDNGRSTMWYIENSAALTSVTATWSGNLSSLIYAVVLEVQGILPANSINGTPVNSTATSNVTSLTSGTLTTTQFYSILIYAVGTSVNVTAFTPPGGYTIPTNGSDARLAVQYKVNQLGGLPFIGTTSMSWTTGSHAGSTFASFTGTNYYEDDSPVPPLILPFAINPEPVISLWG